MSPHRVRTVCSAAALLALSLSACDSGSDAATSTDAPSASVGSSAATTAPPKGSLDVDCLQGKWQMDQPAVEAALQSAYPIPELSVPLGTMSLEYIGEQVVFKGQFRLDITVAEVDMQADADFTRIGDFHVSGDSVDNVYTTAEGGIEPFVEVQPDGSTKPAPISPTLDPPDINGGTTTCTPDTLTFVTSISGQPATFVFSHVAS